MKIESAAALNTPKKHQIFIVDDHPVFRSGLARTIQLEKDMEVWGEAANATEALQKLNDSLPDLATIDLSMEGMNGLDLIKAIREKNSKIRLLVVSAHKESFYAEASLRVGSNGYIMKRESGQKLLEAIRSVLEGKTYLSEEANRGIIDKFVGPRALDDDPRVVLTPRELDTFRLIGQGLGTRQIAESLNISMKTVEAHREHIRAKYNLRSNYQLVQQAIKWVNKEMPLL